MPLDVRRHEQKYLKSINVLAQVGNSVEVQQVHNLTRAQRSEVARHWNLVHKYVDGNRRAGRQLERYEAKMTGGDFPAEFANHLPAIDQFALTHRDELRTDSIYPEAS
ncbi:hypothetical protein [Streptomyces iranensis]|uniref:hypothetical protein n=1 Tax=Streptomyces iranensis TaxID=576784 RepID=UPI0039B7380D